mmetsp:Transcript_46039/g.55416  ORF Transcript_46039/g.55416 Transcript_46039/m.55416 type:complete len:270 (-) Transcript_46039:624-1433(-)
MPTRREISPSKRRKRRWVTPEAKERVSSFCALLSLPHNAFSFAAVYSLNGTHVSKHLITLRCHLEHNGLGSHQDESVTIAESLYTADMRAVERTLTPSGRTKGPCQIPRCRYCTGCCGRDLNLVHGGPVSVGLPPVIKEQHAITTRSLNKVSRVLAKEALFEACAATPIHRGAPSPHDAATLAVHHDELARDIETDEHRVAFRTVRHRVGVHPILLTRLALRSVRRSAALLADRGAITTPLLPIHGAAVDVESMRGLARARHVVWQVGV